MPPLPVNMVEVDVYAGDSGYTLNFTLQNSDGTAFNLTGSTLTMKIQQVGTDTIGTGNMTILSPTAGTCSYIVATGDFPNVANYYMQIIVVTSTSTVRFGNILAVAQGSIVIK